MSRHPRHVRVMSDLPLKPDIHQRGLHVRLVPLADTVCHGPGDHDGVNQRPPRCRVSSGNLAQQGCVKSRRSAAVAPRTPQ